MEIFTVFTEKIFVFEFFINKKPISDYKVKKIYIKMITFYCTLYYEINYIFKYNNNDNKNIIFVIKRWFHKVLFVIVQPIMTCRIVRGFFV